MTTNDFEARHILTKLKCADATLQMIRDIYPEAASYDAEIEAPDVAPMIPGAAVEREASSPVPLGSTASETPAMAAPGRGTGDTA